MMNLEEFGFYKFKLFLEDCEYESLLDEELDKELDKFGGEEDRNDETPIRLSLESENFYEDTDFFMPPRKEPKLDCEIGNVCPFGTGDTFKRPQRRQEDRLSSLYEDDFSFMDEDEFDPFSIGTRKLTTNIYRPPKPMLFDNSPNYVAKVKFGEDVFFSSEQSKTHTMKDMESQMENRVVSGVENPQSEIGIHVIGRKFPNVTGFTFPVLGYIMTGKEIALNTQVDSKKCLTVKVEKVRKNSEENMDDDRNVTLDKDWKCTHPENLNYDWSKETALFDLNVKNFEPSKKPVISKKFRVNSYEIEYPPPVIQRVKVFPNGIRTIISGALRRNDRGEYFDDHANMDDIARIVIYESPYNLIHMPRIYIGAKLLKMQMENGEQKFCCVEKCERNVNDGRVRRKKGSMKLCKTFKEGYDQLGWDVICGSCYYRDNYMYKKGKKKKAEKKGVTTYEKVKKREKNKKKMETRYKRKTKFRASRY